MYFRKVLICNDKVHYLEVYLSVLRNTGKCSKYIYFSNIILSASTVFKNTLLRTTQQVHIAICNVNSADLS